MASPSSRRPRSRALVDDQIAVDETLDDDDLPVQLSAEALAGGLEVADLVAGVIGAQGLRQVHQAQHRGRHDGSHE